MTDIVKRLRRTYRKEYAPTGSSVANPLDRLRSFPIAAVDVYHNPDGKEAADRIEALEAENARFRKALEFYADDYPFGNEARKALGVV